MVREKMALIGFTVFKDKILDGTKKQTIRKLRKKPVMVGERLHLYWKLRTKQCESLGSYTCKDTFRITIAGRNTILHSDGQSDARLLSDDEIADLAVRDGFNNGGEMFVALTKMHKNWEGEVFQVIRW